MMIYRTAYAARLMSKAHGFANQGLARIFLSCPRRPLLGSASRALTVSVLAAQIVVLCAASPAAAISADLAKKCRAMALKAHPAPSPPGNKAYAQAERDFFADCVSKNGQMQGAEAPKNSTDSK